MRQYFHKVLPKLSSTAGFSLVEVFISLFVFAIGMLAVTAMCLLSIRGNSLTNRVTQANFFAQSLMEELLGVPAVCTYNSPTNGSPGFGYNSTILVNATGDTCWVTVTVEWGDSSGSHEVELKTLARGD